MALTKIVKYKVEADTKKAVTNLDKLDTALDNVEKEAKQAKVAVKNVGSASQTAGAGFKYGGSEAGKLTGVLSLISPEAAAAADGLGKVAEGADLFGGAAVLTSPIAAGLAVAIGLGTAAYILYNTQAQEAERIEKEIKKTKEDSIIATLDHADAMTRLSEKIKLYNEDNEEGLKTLKLTSGAELKALADRRAAQDKYNKAKEELLSIDTRLKRAVKGGYTGARAEQVNAKELHRLQSELTTTLGEINSRLGDRKAMTLKAAKAEEEYTKRLKGRKDAEGDGATGPSGPTPAEREAAGLKILADQMKEIETLTNQRASSENTLAGILQSANADTLTASEKAQEATQAKLDAIDAEIVKLDELTAAGIGTEEARTEAAVARFAVVAEGERAQSKIREDEAKKEKDRKIKEAELGASIAQSGLDTLGAALDAAGENSKARFIAEKLAGIGMIAVNTAIAVSKVTAQTGVGAVLAVPAVIASGIAQAAAVAAQQPPTYHAGVAGVTGAGEVTATLQTGESVLSRAATARLGTDRINDMNAGMNGAGGSIVVVNQYKHRVFDAFVTDNLKRSSPLRRAISSNSTYGQK